jgi:acetyl-CoA C-acetyltransferase
MTGAAAVVGVHEHPLRTAPGYSALRFAGESARAALEDAGLRPEDVDGLCVAGDSMAGVYVAEYLNLSPGWLDTTSIGGSSFVSHVLHAADAIAAGHASVVLIVFGSVARSMGAAFGSTARVPQAADPMGVDDFEGLLEPYGVILAAQYALVASRHMHEYGTTREQLAAVAVAMRANASLNPNALLRTPISVDDVLASRPIATPLHLLDCCVITDGGGAIVVAASAVARSCRKAPVRILGGAEAVGHGQAGSRRLLDLAGMQSGPRALQRAGVTPADVDLCMIYDSFTISVLTALEALGFCAPGEGGDLVTGDSLRHDSALPVNPDGGALSSNHPGRRGAFLVIEATRQLRGEAGERQVADPRVAVCHGIGGYLGGRHSAITAVLGRD